MLTLEPVHLQIAGIAIVVLIAVGFAIWIARAVVRPKRGRAIYMLGQADNDEHGEDDEGLDVR
jgi:hypothetical protein